MPLSIDDDEAEWLDLVMGFLCYLRTISTAIVSQEYETIPLGFHAALNELRHRIHFNSERIPGHIEPNDLLNYITRSDNETTSCDTDITVLVEAALRRELWSLKVFDSWGKPLPSGLLHGNTFWMGDYNECMEPLYQPTSKSFLHQPIRTQYCTLYPSQLLNSTFGSISLGICLPASCDRAAIARLIRGVFDESNFTVDHLSCSNNVDQNSNSLSNGALITCIFLSFIALFVLTGTVIDILLLSRTTETIVQTEASPHESNRLPQCSIGDSSKLKFLAEFSVLRTLRRTFTMTEDDRSDSLPFINGIRVLSLLWVIFGHVFFYGLFFASNLLDIVSWTQNFAFQLINSGVLAVDTFFVLSGFLTAFLFVRQANKQKLSVRFMVLYYLHRYIRLTPTFMLVVLVSITLTPYFGDGPFYPREQGFESDGCHRYWWTSILYVANLVQPDSMCLSISWYLHNDMQFYWIAPLALIPFVMGRKRIGFLVTILFILISIGSIAGILVYYPTMSANGLQLTTPPDEPSFPNKIYIAPWCRISPYAMGLLTGLVVSDTGKTYHLNTFRKVIGNIVVLVLTFACLFILYWDSIGVDGLNRSILIVYQSLSRWCWSLVISWVLFLCSTNQGGLINKILSWSLWKPIARLNYAAYLIHTTVLLTTLLNQKISSSYQPLTLLNNFVSCVFFSYAAATVIVVFFETPFAILERKIFKR